MEIAIKKYIEREVSSLKDKLYPLFTLETKEMTACYLFDHMAGGHVRESQLTIKVISGDYDKAKELEKKLVRLLNMEEDVSFISEGDIYFHSTLTGGGVLFNDGVQMYEDTLIFYILWRTKK